MAHTPGPWDDDGYRVWAPGRSHIVIEYGHAGLFNPYDARLIAAAPDLLEALRMAKVQIDLHSADYHHVTPAAIKFQIDAAIAKAEGKA